MYDSVKRFEPMRSGSSANTLAARSSNAKKLVNRAATREVENRARGERAVLGAEPRHERRDLLDLAETPHGDLREHEVDVRLGHLAEHPRLHRGRRHAVHADPGPRKLLAQGFRERDDTGLGS